MVRTFVIKKHTQGKDVHILFSFGLKAPRAKHSVPFVLFHAGFSFRALGLEFSGF